MADQKVKLSKKTVEALGPRLARYTVRDSEVSGFGVRVSPSGVRSYVFEYRMPGFGRRRSAQKLTLGKHGVITADQARDMAKHNNELVRKGHDPARERSMLAERPTVAHLAKLYLTWVRQRRKVTSAEDVERIINQRVLPAIGKLAVADVRRRDIKRIVDAVAAEGKHRTSGKVVQYCKSMFNLAMLDEDPWLEMRAPGTNPCFKLKAELGERRKRALSIHELRRLGRALREAAIDRDVNPWQVALLYLCLLTGRRLREIMAARWDQVDFQHRTLKLPDTKTGPQLVYLSNAAIAVLERIPRLPANPYIICGAKPGRPLSNPYPALGRIRKRAKIPDLWIHDTRRTHASVGLGEGLNLDKIGALLGHASVDTTKSYAFLLEDPAREGTALVGGTIQRLLDGPEQLGLFQQPAPSTESAARTPPRRRQAARRRQRP